MSKNIKLNNTSYNGVSTVQLPTTTGGKATFKDVDEITTPSGTKTITENGTHDVKNYAQAVVNVASSGGSDNDAYIDSFKAVIQRNGIPTRNITIPDGVERISDAVLSMNTVSKIIVPDSVKIFGTACFKNCTNLTEVNIPPNLERMENEVFYYCTNFNMDIVLPESINYVGQYAFYGSNVKNVTFKGVPTSIHTSAFKSDMVINVPWSEGEVEGAPWGASLVNYNHTGE